MCSAPAGRPAGAGRAPHRGLAVQGIRKRMTSRHIYEVGVIRSLKGSTTRRPTYGSQHRKRKKERGKEGEMGKGEKEINIESGKESRQKEEAERRTGRREGDMERKGGG